MRIVEKLKHDRRGRPSKYNFEQWADGQVRECDVQAEFGIKPSTFKGMLHTYAREHCVPAKFCVVEGTVIQFVLGVNYV